MEEVNKPTDKVRKTTTYNGKEVEYEDATPTWEEVLPLLLSTQHTESSRIELFSMARAADKYNCLLKRVSEDQANTLDSFKKLIAIIRNPSKLNDGSNMKIIDEIEELITQYERENKEAGE